MAGELWAGGLFCFVLGFFFFLNLEPSCTWLYCFRFLAGSDFRLLGREMWEIDAAVSLRERERSLQRKDLVKIRSKKTRGGQRFRQSAPKRGKV